MAGLHSMKLDEYTQTQLCPSSNYQHVGKKVMYCDSKCLCMCRCSPIEHVECHNSIRKLGGNVFGMSVCQFVMFFYDLRVKVFHFCSETIAICKILVVQL